jgi:fused signal recognition particle receptor
MDLFWRRRPPAEPDAVDSATEAQAPTTATDDAEPDDDVETPARASDVPSDAGRVDADANPALEAGLERTRRGFIGRLRGFFGADETSWDDVEETLIGADVGAALAMDVVEHARRRRDAGGGEAAVRAELAALLVPRDGDWKPRPAAAGSPAIVLVVGVNGTGKTTTIGKLAARYGREGHTVVLAAADTFRAAAIDQLRIWAERANAQVVAHELRKVRRIVERRLPGAEPETLFVLDATTGQNGLAQARAFHEAVGLTGIVLTKLDSTAKGGIVFAIEDALQVPVRFVGVGESVDDLLPFDPEAFVQALFA